MSQFNIVWPEPGDLIPELLEPYVDVHGLLQDSVKLTGIEKGFRVRPANLLFNGVQGIGKTLLAATIAVELGKRHPNPVPYVVYDCSEDTREYSLMGTSQILPDGSTAFIPGPFPLVLEMANRTGLAVLCLEEISALSPGAQKVVNRLTDWRRSLYVPQIGKPIVLRPEARVIVIATMNPAAFGGVNSLNPDLRSRFTERLVPLPTMDQERKVLRSICPYASDDVIDKALVMANDCRASSSEYKLSTRDMVQLLENIEKMEDLEVPLTCIIDKFESGSERDLMIDQVDDAFATKLKTRLKAQAV